MRTPGRRAEIQLGDLLRALARLPCEHEPVARTMATCLGFGVATAPDASPETIFDRHHYPDTQTPPAAPAAPPPVFAPPVPAVQPPPLPDSVLPTPPLQPLEPVPPQTVAAPRMNVPDSIYDPVTRPPLARETLFPERTNRHLLSAALAMRREGHEIDLPRLIESLASGVSLGRLPRRAEATLELGCQALLDYSASMTPFWEDLNALMAQMTAVIGADQTRVYSFATRPDEAWRWTAGGQRESWRPDGRPVLAATDLGIVGRPAHARPDPRWPAFAAACAQAGSPLVILIPWPRAYWPRVCWSAGSAGRPILVHWSPHTTAAMIRRHIGPGHRLRR